MSIAPKAIATAMYEGEAVERVEEVTENVPPSTPWRVPSIQTYTGIEFFPLDPNPGAIVPRDVAHALSLKCRYTGHCAFFFSVAQHCVLLSDYVHALGLSLVHQRWALLHDASEAYLPDVAGPIKSHLPGFVEIEDRLHRAVAERFELPWPMPGVIKDLDRLMYWRERMKLLGDAPWIKVQQDVVEVPEDMLERVPIEHWTPQVAEQHWWVSFCHLFPDETADDVRNEFVGGEIQDWEALG